MSASFPPSWKELVLEFGRFAIGENQSVIGCLRLLCLSCVASCRRAWSSCLTFVDVAVLLPTTNEKKYWVWITGSNSLLKLGQHKVKQYIWCPTSCLSSSAPIVWTCTDHALLGLARGLASTSDCCITNLEFFSFSYPVLVLTMLFSSSLFCDSTSWAKSASNKYSEGK